MLHDWFLASIRQRVDKATNCDGRENIGSRTVAPETVAI